MKAAAYIKHRVMGEDELVWSKSGKNRHTELFTKDQVEKAIREAVEKLKGK